MYTCKNEEAIEGLCRPVLLPGAPRHTSTKEAQKEVQPGATRINPTTYGGIPTRVSVSILMYMFL